MMESSHLDHYHQEELHGFSSSLATVPAFYDHLPSSRAGWNQGQILSCGEFLGNVNTGSLPCADQSHEVSPASSQPIQHLGFHHLPSIHNQESFLNHLPSPGHRLNVETKLKADLPDDDAFPNKLNQLFKDHRDGDYGQLHQKLFVRALDSSDCQVDGGLHPLPGNLTSEAPGFDEYEGGRESLNCMAPFRSCSLSQPPTMITSGSLDMDLRALDLLASARLGRSFCQPSLVGMNLSREDAAAGLEQLQESIQGPFYHHQKMPSLVVSGVAEGKGSISTWEHKSSQTALRKPRFEQRSSFSPFKVRKEKLGDRIAALQQLVAPFGKTDTASVLMEAIGYIKFLLDQVEKLSVPYMRSSGNKRSRTLVKEASEDGESNYEIKRDLRSRGLCLVPLSCTSYMTTEHGVWTTTPSNYGGGTSSM